MAKKWECRTKQTCIFLQYCRQKWWIYEITFILQARVQHVWGTKKLKNDRALTSIWKWQEHWEGDRWDPILCWCNLTELHWKKWSYYDSGQQRSWSISALLWDLNFSKITIILSAVETWFFFLQGYMYIYFFCNPLGALLKIRKNLRASNLSVPF